MVLAGQVENIAGKTFQAFQHPVSGVPLHQVVVAHDQDNIQRLLRGQHGTVQPESVEEGVHAGARYGDVVTMHHITFVSWWGKKFMES